MFLYMQQNNEMEAKLLDLDYHYGYYSDQFIKFRSLNTIITALWRVLNPELYRIRNNRDVNKSRALHPELQQIRNRLYNRSYHIRLRIQLRIT